MAQSNDLTELIKIIYKWRKPMIIVLTIAVILSCVISFLMPEYFKSSVNFYPSNPIMTDRQVLYSQSAGEIEIDYFGSSGDVDRILTLAYTSGIIDYIINKFHLVEHYGYDSTKTLARYNTREKFENNYRVVETEYGAIEISVWDTDPNLAAEIANHIAFTIDNHNKDMLLRDKRLIIETFKKQADVKELLVDKLKDSISTSKKNHTDSETLLILESKLQAAIDDYNGDKKILEQNLTTVNTDFSTIHVTEEAFPAVKKDKPVRSLIVIGVTLGTFLFMVILAVITENFRKIKKQMANA